MVLEVAKWFHLSTPSASRTLVRVLSEVLVFSTVSVSQTDVTANVLTRRWTGDPQLPSDPRLPSVDNYGIYKQAVNAESTQFPTCKEL